MTAPCAVLSGRDRERGRITRERHTDHRRMQPINTGIVLEVQTDTARRAAHRVRQGQDAGLGDSIAAERDIDL